MKEKILISAIGLFSFGSIPIQSIAKTEQQQPNQNLGKAPK